MAKDLVCGMAVDEETAKLNTTSPANPFFSLDAFGKV